MKKIIVLLLLALSLFSTAFSAGKATDKATEDAYLQEIKAALNESLLKAPRWMFATTVDKQVNTVLFYDVQSIVSPYPNVNDVWIGAFYRGKGPCEYPECAVKLKKHYHLSRWRIDNRLRQFVVTAIATRDEKYGLVDSVDVPSYLQKPKTIEPGTVGEQIMNEINEMQTLKSGGKSDKKK